MYRQGDILLIPIESVSNVVEVKGDVLAVGEATGHAHRVEDPSKAQVVEAEIEGEKFDALVVQEPTALVHEEHGTVPVPVGTYLIRRQREVNLAQGWRRVSD